MATYFHGNSEIQAADGLQTLVLMNPAGYVPYSDTPPPPPTAASNLIFLNSPNSLTHPPANLTHAPQSHTQQFVGIPLPSTASSQDPHSQSMHAHHHHEQLSALHGLMPRLQYNLWNSIDPSTAARETPRAQQGLSLSLSSQQPGYGSFRGGDREVAAPQSQAQAISGEDMRVSGGSASSVSGVTNGVSGMQSVLLSSKYLKAAQELLDEVVNVGNGIRTETSKKNGGQQSKIMGGESLAAVSCDGSVGGEGSGKRAADLSTAERQEIQMKKAKLISMLDEVYMILLYIYLYTIEF